MQRPCVPTLAFRNLLMLVTFDQSYEDIWPDQQKDKDKVKDNDKDKTRDF